MRKKPEPCHRATPDWITSTSGVRVKVFRPKNKMSASERDFIETHFDELGIEANRISMSPVFFDLDFLPWKFIFIDDQPALKLCSEVPQRLTHKTNEYPEAVLIKKVLHALQRYLIDGKFRSIVFKCVWMEKKHVNRD